MKKYLISASAAALSLALAGPAAAATLTDTLGEFNFDGNAPFPTPEQLVGTFTFAIPNGETIISATVSGTYGNSVVPNSAGVDLYGDGDFLGQCVEFDTCYSSQTVTAFSYAVTDLSKLLDGSYDFSIIQTSEFVTRLGRTTLTIETAVIPLPAGLPLLLAGLGGLAALRRKRAA